MFRSTDREHGYDPHNHERQADTRQHEPQIGDSALYEGAFDRDRVFWRN
jgi:hypothetical protein